MIKIGKQIQELRKQKRVTQEELGKAVGVTTQAVSKWENGGTPDAELLPAIADFFHVQIYYLYGRANEHEVSLPAFVYQELCKQSDVERASQVYEVLHSILNACSEIPDIADILHSESLNLLQAKTMKFGYQIINDHLIGFLSLMEYNPYCFFIPEPKDGYLANFLSIEQYQQIFSFLSQPCVLDILIQMYQMKFQTCFTLKMLAKKSSIPATTVHQILTEMVEKKWVEHVAVETDEQVMDAYVLQQNAAFIPFMLLANEIAEQTNVGYAIVQREAPILYQSYKKYDKSET